ncbi:monovalent cation/H+ antiporter complex subunit F [Georgenia wangjunii]|uniref:monovalent cation/H+ antiporter complex subunit F n=1 Tax=Georgenia wangjunii TaxID=3117730 RepID=UPI002F26A0DB
MTVVYVITFTLLAAAALLAIVRMERGPSMFDRIVAVDVMTAVVLGTVSVVSALTGRADLVPVLVVLALVGFVSAVSIARFAAAESADEARILTKAELAEVLAQRDALASDDAPPVHDIDTSVVIAVLDVPGAPARPVAGQGAAHAGLASAEEAAGGQPSAGSPGDPGDALSLGRNEEPHERDDSDPSAPAGSPDVGGAR